MDTERVSPYRDHALGAVFREQTGTMIDVAELRRLYATWTSVFLDAVRPEAVCYVHTLLARQEPVILSLMGVVDRDSQRLRQAALEAVRYSMTQRIDSSSGKVLHPDEAAALGSLRKSGSSSAIDRFERVRFTRAVRVGGDPDLRKLMAHPSGVAILKAYTRSVAEGRGHATARLRQSRDAIPTVLARIDTDPLAIWRVPPAIAGGVARLGLAKHHGAVQFAVAWAALKSRSFMEKALDVALNAIAILDLAGPLGRLVGAALGVVLSAAGTAMSFLRELEQDQAGYGSAFAPDDEKLSAGGDYLGVAFHGVAALAALVALPGAVSSLSRRSGTAARAATTAVPEHPLATTRGVDGRSLPKKVVAMDAAEATEHRLGAAQRGVNRAASADTSAASSATARDIASAPASINPEALAHLDEGVELASDPAAIWRHQKTRPLAESGDPVAERLHFDRAKETTAAASAQYRGIYGAGMAQRDKALKFINLKYAIEMTQEHIRKAVRTVTATGMPRNSRVFWKEMLDDYPHLFSPRNVKRILNKRAPRVDDTWLDYHKVHSDYKNQILVHHHVDQYGATVGIPEGVHRKYHAELHPWSYPDVLD